jgi:ADP-ribosyl-[dinitrogen reductase] hydrolase
MAETPALPDLTSDPLSSSVLSMLTEISFGARALDSGQMQRALGALIGAAVGDALGAPFEFGPAGRYSATFPTDLIGGLGEMIGGGSFGWEPGEFTDDTQMALVLAESVLDHVGFDPGSLFSAWAQWAESAVDVGITTRSALFGADWRTAAASAHLASGRTAANGALMRTFPIGVLAAGLDDRFGRWTAIMMARAQSALTHGDPAAGWGAALASETVRASILGRPFDEALDDALAALPDEQRVTFEHLLAEGWQPSHHEAPSNGSVWGCLAQAVWGVRQAETFAETIRRVIDLGGDTDTVACVAGALAGARFGLAAVPSRWPTYVHGTVPVNRVERSYGNAELQDVVRRLLGRDVAPAAASESHAGPTEVSPGLCAASLPGAVDAVRSGDSDVAVLSMCRTDGAFASVAVRREVYLIDKAGGRNPRLDLVVADAVDTLDAWLAEGRRVVVHCHGGRSRTGLVLLAWAMRRHGWSLSEAQHWLRGVWPRYDDWNPDFSRFLEVEWFDTCRN